MKRMLSAIKPSGQLTIGNYIGALKNFVSYQEDYEVLVFIANLHCITVYQPPEELNKNLRDATALYLAAGLDPKKATLFLQSDVLEHAQLGYIMQCYSYMGELNRMTQYKDKVAKNETGLTVGLYTYPTLMAADILLYDTDYVPVGIDQKQHVELTRDIAVRMNNLYQRDLFTVPEPVIEQVGAKIYSLSDPTKKMSKSDTLDDKGTIYLLDDPKKARKKIMSAVTDSYNQITFDPEKQPGIANLLTIGASLKNISIDQILEETKGFQYGALKKYVADIVENFLVELQAKYHNVLESGLIDETFKAGAQKARKIAREKLETVQEIIGLEI